MELLGNVRLACDQDYQAVYASQLYGTFFMIYAKFTCDSGQADVVSDIDLLILNYKGAIDLGITRARAVPRKDAAGNEVGLMIVVEVEALHPQHEADVDMGGNTFHCPTDSRVEVVRTVSRSRTHVTDGLFDQEFYYREGFEFNEATGKYESVPHERTDIFPMTNYDDVPDQGTVGSVICPRSMNKVII